MLRPILSAVALTLALAAPSGAAEKVTEYDRFQLWNDCRTVGLIVEKVEKLNDDAGKIDLRKEDIEIAVRARLRGARIYEDFGIESVRSWLEGPRSFLHVSVHVVSRAYHVRVELHRHVKVLLPPRVKPKGMDPLTGYAIGWRSGSTGLHGVTGSQHVLSVVANHTDRFIDEFLRVNDDACRT